jgi:hypothetical protein
MIITERFNEFTFFKDYCESTKFDFSVYCDAHCKDNTIGVGIAFLEFIGAISLYKKNDCNLELFCNIIMKDIDLDFEDSKEFEFNKEDYESEYRRVLNGEGGDYFGLLNWINFYDQNKNKFDLKFV